MLLAIAFVFLLIGHSDAWLRTCNSYFDCSNDNRVTCYVGDKCVCPEGYKYFPMCAPQFSCTGNCSEIIQEYLVCMPEDFCTAEETVLAFRYCSYRVTARCEYKHNEHWLLRHRRYYMYFILGLIVLYVQLKFALQCCKRA